MPAPGSRRFEAALIDLDGTLVDTLPEIAATANAMLRDAGREPVSERSIAEAVGEGSASLVAHLVGRDGVDRWLPVYMAHYRTFNGTTGTVYPNAVAGLEAMREAGLRVACVTNKPRELVAPLFEHLGILDRFDCIVGGGDTVDKKPLPAPLLLTCERLGVDPEHCVMIGDSKNDALAARAAGMVSLTVPYGYPGFGGDADRAEALLERGDTCAIVPDLLEAAAWIAAASTTSRTS
jgi:phosphoglycolate phosphatase